MTTSTFHRLISAENLRLAWDEFWRSAANQRSSGVDGVTPATFKLRLAHNLAETRSQLLSGYTFSPLKGYPVPKKDGRSRIICIPTVRDRLVQRLLGSHLGNQAVRLGILNEVSFGFIPKRGIRPARDRAIALRHTYRWAYKSDISSFFDRIPRDQLVEETIRALRTRSFRPIVTAAASCELNTSDAVVARIARENGIEPGLGVRQGMPLSPMFANIILRHFDQGMIAARKRIVRYADDFIALASSEKECREIDALARELLKPLNLCLPLLDRPDSKTVIAPPDQEIEFLGMALVPTPGSSTSCAKRCPRRCAS